MARTPEIGQIPPDFALPGIELDGDEVVQGEYSLAEQRGKPIVLAFYPGDNTSVCTKQLCSYTSGLESFTGFGAAVWAISPQGLASHEQFARKYGLRFPLLADESLAVSRKYGISLGRASLRRSVFVLDAAGVLRWKHVALVGLTFPPAATISAQLSALRAA